MVTTATTIIVPGKVTQVTRLRVPLCKKETTDCKSYDSWARGINTNVSLSGQNSHPFACKLCSDACEHPLFVFLFFILIIIIFSLQALTLPRREKASVYTRYRSNYNNWFFFSVSFFTCKGRFLAAWQFWVCRIREDDGYFYERAMVSAYRAIIPPFTLFLKCVWFFFSSFTVIVSEDRYGVVILTMIDCRDSGFRVR